MSLIGFSFASVMTYAGYIILAILVLLLMVMIHELGHYTAGKILKFKINEFSIGFGKSIFSKTNKKGEKFSIRIFPLGGYCAFEGEDQDKPENKDAFNSQKPWKRLIVLFSGAFFNLIAGVLFSFIFLTAFGYHDVVQVVSKQQTAVGVSQLEVGDVVLEVDGTKCNFVYDNYFSTLISKIEGSEPIQLLVKRDGNKIEIEVYKSFTEESSENLLLGITTNPYKYGFFEALWKSIPFTFGWAWKVLVILFMLITGQVALNQIGGPIATITVMASATQASAANLFLLLPLISANLAVFNLLPFPALDGSRMVFVLIEWIRGKPVSRKIEGYVHMAGLIILFAFIIIVDIIFLISKFT